jgi:low temperature requirement protein LtrA
MAEPRDDGIRVTTLELFFDLVFVFTITQLTTVLFHDPSWRGLAKVVLMLGVIWWMYGGYAWLTNTVVPDRAGRRTLLLGGMAGYLVLALSIPHAFSGSGPAFAIAYLCVVAVHAALFARAESATVTQAVLRLAPFNLLSALLILAGGLAGGAAEYALFTVAVAFEWVTPRLIRLGAFAVRPAHFVERHGLVVIVAIGESVVAIGIGAAAIHTVDVELAVVAILGLLLNAGLWWLYFGNDDDALAERALAEAPPSLRPRIAVDGFGVWHLPLLLGIVAIASALRAATGHAFHDLSTAHALALGGGLAVYLAGDVGFRRTLGLGRGRLRLAAAVLALVTVPLGSAVAAFAQIAALVAMLALVVAGERRQERISLGRAAARFPETSPP